MTFSVNKYIRLALSSFALASVVASPMTFANDDAATLRAKLGKIESLHATFTQEVTDINKRVIQSGNGIFAIAYPQQFYWHLTEPDESLIVADGTSLFIYNPFAEEVTVMDIAQAVEASPMALLVHRDDKTWSQYNVSQSKDNCFSVVPKSTDASLTSVTVCFNQQTLSRFSLLDDQGNLSQFTLTEQRSVKEGEKSLFHFAIPDNVDIDDQRLKQVN